jgi:hypothetical protein
VASPMVDQSELPFRLLCRRYNAHLCYTPMLHAARFVRDATYRSILVRTCAEDRPLIAQLAGHDPVVMVAAGKLVEGQVSLHMQRACTCSLGSTFHLLLFARWTRSILILAAPRTLQRRGDMVRTCCR